MISDGQLTGPWARLETVLYRCKNMIPEIQPDAGAEFEDGIW